MCCSAIRSPLRVEALARVLRTCSRMLPAPVVLRAAVTTLAAWVVPTAVYGVNGDFIDGRPSPEILERLRQGLAETEVVLAAHQPV